jgi:hypothetical protein
VAASVGLSTAPTLRELAEAAESPWVEILSAHREALLAVTGAIAELGEANRRLAETDPEAAPPVTGIGPSIADFLE